MWREQKLARTSSERGEVLLSSYTHPGTAFLDPMVQLDQPDNQLNKDSQTQDESIHPSPNVVYT
jgi:hypothetical protein